MHVKNYKSLRNVSLEGLKNLVIFIGPNSSGKSNFLEILYRFFAEIDLTGVAQGINTYSWFDGNQEEPIEVTVTIEFDEEECNEVFPQELLNIMKKKFSEKYRELSICRNIVKPPVGWKTKSIKWADIPLVEDEKPITIDKLAVLLGLRYIPFEDIQAVFFAPGASNKNITGDRLVLIKSLKKAFFMGPYADQLVRSGKVKWINVSDKITDWKKFASEKGYTVVEQPLSEEDLNPHASWLKPQLISDTMSRILSKIKGRFKLILAVRNSWPQNPLQRSPFIDSETQSTLREMGLSEEREKQKNWSKIKHDFNELTGYSLEPHPSYLRVVEGDLFFTSSIQRRGRTRTFIITSISDRGRSSNWNRRT